MMLRLLAFTAALFFCAPAQAHAAFLIPIVATALAVSTAVAEVIVTVGLMALSYGLSWAASKLFPPPGMDIGGAELDLRVDATVPQSLIVGTAVTAGSLVYAEVYGKRGKIDNSDLIRIFAIADHACTAISKSYVEDVERVTTPQVGGDPEKSFSTDAGNRGEIVDGYNFKLAIKFYLGDQTAADDLAVLALGTHPDRPWGADKIGRGRTYAREHAIYDQDVLTSPPRWRFVVDGIKLYDPRKDTTVGGSGAHRFNDLTTHEFTRNLIVIAYNILRGIRVTDADGVPQHFYGLEGTAAANLPLDNWFAAMNEADVVIDGEPQFHGGMEIKVSDAPLDVVKQIMRACDGRFTEVGGVYKAYVGAPGLPVITIDDGVLRADDGDDFNPILPLTQRVNYVTATYMEPGDGWNPKVAPPRGNSDYEAEDGRRIEADLNLPLVQSAAHMQRLQLQMLNRSRRQRRHAIPLPPSCYGIEPGDVIEWNSDRNGYVEKLFEVDAVDILPNLNSTVSLIEVDPADYDWNGETDFVDQLATSLVVDRPSPKVIVGFDVEAIKIVGDNGIEKPGLRVAWGAPEDGDVSAVQWQFRRTSAPSDISEGKTNDVAALQVLLVGGFQSATSYDVRARFESFNGYSADWSLWQTVATPQCGEVNLSVLTAAVNDLIAGGQKALQDAMQEAQQLVASLSAAQDGQNWLDKVETRRLLSVARDDLSASIEEVETVALSTDAALTSYTTTASARFAENEANIVINATGIATLNASFSSYQTTVSARFATNETNIAANTANISTNTTALATLNSSFASYQVTVDARFDTNEADISTNASAISTLDTSFSSYQTTVNAHLGSLDASVSTNSSAIATVDGKLAATATLTTNVSGKISGFKNYNDGTTSLFDIEADKFRVGRAGVTGGTFIDVFSVQTVSGASAIAMKAPLYADLIFLKRMAADNQWGYEKLETGATGARAKQTHAQAALGSWTVNTFTDLVSTTIDVKSGEIEIRYSTTQLNLQRTGTTVGITGQFVFRLLIDNNPEQDFTVIVQEARTAGSYLFVMPFQLPIWQKTGLSVGIHTVKIQGKRDIVFQSPSTVEAGLLRVEELRKAA